jgi:hypothetical protein
MTDILECSICCDEIGCARATLSCNHTFHLGCIGRWILKNETCPMCRGEMEDKERIQEDEEEDEEEEEEESVGDEEEEEDDMDGDDDRSVYWRRVGTGRWIIEPSTLKIPQYNEEEHALWVMRKTFEMVDDGASIEPQGIEVKLAPLDTLSNVTMRQEGVMPFDENQPVGRERSNSI